MLVARCDVIAIEDLHVDGMLKNHKLARAIADRGWGALRRQWEYKAAPRGKTVLVGDRGDPSSKRCSRCGDNMLKMPLAVREWTCPACHTRHDRDVNAAINFTESGREFDGRLSIRVGLTADRLGDAPGEHPPVDDRSSRPEGAVMRGTRKMARVGQ